MSGREILFVALGVLAAFPAGCQSSAPEPGGSDAGDTDWRSLVRPELRYRREPLAEGRNAFVLWSALEPGSLEPQDPRLEEILAEAGEVWEFPGGESGELLRAWLESRRAHLEVIDAGIARGRCQFASVDDFTKVIVTLQEASILKLLRARRLAADGDSASSWREVEGVLALGGILKRAGGFIVSYLTASSFEMMALESARSLAAQKVVPESFLENTRIEEPEDSQRAFESAWRTELDFMISRITAVPETRDPRRLAETLVSGGSGGDAGGAFSAELEPVRRQLVALLEGHPRPFDRKDTVRLANDAVFDVVRNAAKPWPERDRSLERDLLAETSPWPEALRPQNIALFGAGAAVARSEMARARDSLRAVENPLGKQLVRTIFDSAFLGEGLAQSSHAALLRVRAARAATTTVFRLLLHERRNGRLPPELDVLVDSGLLPEAPVDPFSNRPLRYSPERRLLWSVGPDEKDNDAVEPGDLIWRVPGAGS